LEWIYDQAIQKLQKSKKREPTRQHDESGVGIEQNIGKKVVTRLNAKSLDKDKPKEIE